MIIDHIGLVVKSIEKGIEHWRNVFEYHQMTEVVINPKQKVKVVFLDKENSLTVKLVAPLDDTSPVFRFAMKGGGLHHICFKCDEMTEELRRLDELGLRLLAPPEPGEAFENENIAFIYTKHGLNIELIETDIKAKIIRYANE